MQYFRNPSMLSAIALTMGCTTITVHAANEPLAPQDNSIEEINQIINQNQRPEQPYQQLSTNLPSEDSGKQMSKQETIEYLKQNPDEFEVLLSQMLTQGNAAGLAELLPYYQQIEGYDPSVVDWGNAIIAGKKGNLDEAVSLYRKLNAELPNVKVLRFQLGMALFYNRQFDAAQSEFERLRIDTDDKADLQAINGYIDAIKRQSRWNVGASVSYMNDSNITNAPEQGTVITRPDGSSLTYNTPRESGEGLNFSAYGDRKWLYDNKLFTALHLNTYGKYYWDNKNYNDVTAGIGAGVGYQNAITEVELQPFYNKRLYGQGSQGDGSLDDYTDTKGIKLSLNQWLGPKMRYQGLARYAETNYIDRYKFNDGEDILLANTLIFYPDGQQFWTLGADYSQRDSEDESLAYERPGFRIGWGQTWPKGYSTKFDVGYAKRDYKAQDFFGIQRENKEYNMGITAWNRAVSLFGLTPRISWNFNKVESNSAFEEYSKHDVSIELTKAF